MTMRWTGAIMLVSLAACTAKSEEDKTSDPVALVRIVTASSGTGSDSLVVYGSADAGPGGEQAMSSQADAILEAIIAPNGTAVGRGQVVARLRPSATTRLDAVKSASDAAAANASLARAMRLRADGLASSADVDTARAAAASANATRASVAQRGASLVLRAPAAGTVQGLTARPGDVIPAGTAVATIAARGSLRGRFGVDPVLAQRVRPGQPIQIVAVGTSSSVIGRVSGIDPLVDPATRLASIYAQLPPSVSFARGSPLQARLQVGATSTGVTIPYVALLDDGGKSYVFVVDKGLAHRRDVVPGSSQGDTVVIASGLAAGERVVTEGATALDDGMKVRTGPAK